MPDLWTTALPRFHVTPRGADLPLAMAVPPTGVVVVARVDGARMVDADGVFEQFSEALDFPTYFGWNWPAFYDCLRDLNWRRADRYLIVIDNAALALSSSLEERHVFFGVLQKAARRWANEMEIGGEPVIPFNVLLLCEDAELKALREYVAAHT